MPSPHGRPKLRAPEPKPEGGAANFFLMIFGGGKFGGRRVWPFCPGMGGVGGRVGDFFAALTLMAPRLRARAT